MSNKQTAVDFIKTEVEENSDTSFTSIDWDKFDQIIIQAKELEKEQELKKWIETWSAGYDSGFNNGMKKFNNKQHERND
jgi:hypothetical protein